VYNTRTRQPTKLTMDTKTALPPREHIPTVTESWHTTWMKLAIDASRHAKHIDERYRIGCVIVVDNQVVGTGYTGEYGASSTAVECAFKNMTTNIPPNYFFFYHVYVTMEPSGVRLDNRVPEAEIIVKAGCKNVFLGTCEPALYLDEKGYATLIRNNVNISVVDYPEPLKRGDLRHNILQLNKDLIVDGKDVVNRMLRDL
jgi:pyrimidine deaminase RibD-like protein